MKNKKASIGSGMTWLVATIIIFIITMIFVYGAYIINGGNSVNYLREKSNLEDLENAKSIDSQEILFALLKTNIEDKNLRDYLEEDLDRENFEKIENEIKLILNKISNEEIWNFAYHSGSTGLWDVRGDKKFSFKYNFYLPYRYSNIYLSEDKSVSLYLNYPEDSVEIKPPAL